MYTGNEIRGIHGLLRRGGLGLIPRVHHPADAMLDNRFLNMDTVTETSRHRLFSHVCMDANASTKLTIRDLRTGELGIMTETVRQYYDG